MQAFALFSISPSLAFVTVSLTGQIRCWRSEGLEVKQYEVPVLPPDPKKQIRVTAAAIEGNILALGLKDGHVVVLDLSTKSQANVAIGTRPITALCFSAGSSKLYCAEEEGKIFEVKRRGGLYCSFLFSQKAEHQNTWGARTVVVDRNDIIPVMMFDQGVLYVASKSGNRLKAYDSSTGALAKKWTQCSAPPIKGVIKAPSAERDRFGRIACCFEHRHLSFFVGSHTSSLSTDGIPTHLDINLFRAKTPKASKIHILAVTELGYVDIWEVECDTRIGVTPAIGRIHSTNKHPIIDAKFSDIDSVVLVCGPPSNPSFETITYLDKQGIAPSLSVTPAPPKKHTRKGEAASIELRREVHTKSVATLGPLDMTLGQTMKDNVSKQLPVAEEAPSSAIQKAPFLLPGASLEKPLVQAIRANDRDLLRRITSNHNSTIINNTVERLPLDVVYPFLTYTIGQLQESPEEVRNYVCWIKAIFLCHTSYLLSVPHIATSLAPLQTTIEDRLATFDEVTRVQGKLQFLLFTEPTNPGWDLDLTSTYRITDRV